MIGLDTNVVIRYLVQDDPVQSKQASRLIEQAVQGGEILWVSQVTLCEIVWVLEKAYKLSKKEILSVLNQLLRTRQLEIEEDIVAREALHDYEKQSRVGFSDCLIGRQNARRKCICTYTFDKTPIKQLPSTFRSVPTTKA